MNHKQLLTAMENGYAKNLEITRQKNNDYAGQDTLDAFANFKLIEHVSGGKITAEMGFIVRMTDKLIRITNLTTQVNAVKDESIEDTLRDLANYSMLMCCYIKDKKNSENDNRGFIKSYPKEEIQEIQHDNIPHPTVKPPPWIRMDNTILKEG
jgi:hypothetical protein